MLKNGKFYVPPNSFSASKTPYFQGFQRIPLSKLMRRKDFLLSKYLSAYMQMRNKNMQHVFYYKQKPS